MNYYLTHDAAGNVTGNGVSLDGTMPTSGAIPCTAAQYASPHSWGVSNGALVAVTPPAPTPAQVAQAAYAAAIAGGLSITSTGTPTLDGVYDVNAAKQVAIATEAQFISTFAEFSYPAGSTANRVWPMPDGTTRTFPTTGAFLNFAKAAALFVAACDAALESASAMPAATATIA